MKTGGRIGLFSIALMSACSGGGVEGDEPTARAEQAITTLFTLPIPVGLSPQDLVLAASGTVTLNDYSSLVVITGTGTNHAGDIASMGSSGTTTLGVLAVARNVWSRQGIFLRSPHLLGYYKTQGGETRQAGTTIGDPDENRIGVPIRQDPIWVMSLSAPTSGGSDVTVDTGVRPLAPGTYHNVTVNGGTLQLSSGDYSMVGLTINAGATVQMPNLGFEAPRILVGSSLNIHGTGLAREGLVLAYLGTTPVSLEGGFNGDLFLAPNADVSIKVDAAAHFFAKNITLFEGYRVYARAFSPRVQEMFLPTESVTHQSDIVPDTMAAPNPSASEIASAVATTGCGTTPRAFVSYGVGSVLSAEIGASTFTNGTALPLLPLESLPPTATCIGSLIPGLPGPPYDVLYAYPILAGGTPYYMHTPGLDNIMGRLSNSRIMQVGFADGMCRDPISEPELGCPATQPAEGSPCSTATDPVRCSYLGPGGPDGLNVDQVCGCIASTALWHCERRRVEVGGMAVRVSGDCGTSWGVKTVTPNALGVSGLPRSLDRHELYVDPYEDRFFLASLAVNPGARNIIVRGTPKASAPPAMTFSLYRDEARTAAPVVMTSALDEKARLSNGTFGRWTHFVTARCLDNATNALVDIETPAGRREVNLSAGRANDFLCDNSKSLPLSNGFTYLRSPNITAVGIPSTPPRVRVVYHGVRQTDGAQVVHSFLVTVLSRNNYDQAAIQAGLVHEFTIEDTAGSRNVALPQLMGVDSLGGSNILTDTPMVLRYAIVDATTVDARATVIYSGLRAATDLEIGASNMSQMFGGACPGTLIPGTGYSKPCFFGDYQYGAFSDKRSSDKRLRFFTPYAGQALTGGVSGIHAVGATVNVTP